jgi:hypothetical protein
MLILNYNIASVVVIETSLEGLSQESSEQFSMKWSCGITTRSGIEKSRLGPSSNDHSYEEMVLAEECW